MGAGSGDISARVPPGQYLTSDFPVLTAGPTPQIPLDRWSFEITGLVREPIQWSWDEFHALPARDWTVDISCVTKWTKLDMRWRGVSIDTLLEHVEIDLTENLITLTVRRERTIDLGAIPAAIRGAGFVPGELTLRE